MIDFLTDELWDWLTKHVSKPYFWIVTLSFIVFAFAYRAWRDRIHHGDYKFQSNRSDIVFESGLGKFVFNKDKKSFVANYRNKRNVILSFDDIKNIAIITEDIEAMFTEIVLEDWNIFIDTLPEYRDVVKKYSIAVVTKNFQRYPLIVMSQYTIKDFWAWGLQMQLDFLCMMRLYTPIDLYTEEIYTKFKTALNETFDFDKYKI